MPLGPEAARLLAARKTSGARPVAELAVAESRTATRSCIGLQGDPVLVARVHDIPIPRKTGSGARVYVPHGEPPSACPVHFHGGGWVTEGPGTQTDRRVPARRGPVAQ